ncbi:hypothetical protein FOA52_012881 [Chlamydomonas sp. UWO 241]|nr:hypothetical protein FOA52_012881 [Chlamydomonas sp. UWO 241]
MAAGRQARAAMRALLLVAIVLCASVSGSIGSPLKEAGDSRGSADSKGATAELRTLLGPSLDAPRHAHDPDEGTVESVDRKAGRSLLQGLNNDAAWYGYTFAGPTCPPCSEDDGDRMCAPCNSDDLAAGDATMCHIPYYYGGTESDANICGEWLTPYNLGRADLQATVDGVSQNIGFLMSYMTLDGKWYGVIQMSCPWMMVVDPTTPDATIEFTVTNEAYPDTAWSETVTRNTQQGVRYRTCSTFSVDAMESAGTACTPNEITMTVSFLAETKTANDWTCDTHDANTENTLVTATLKYTPLIVEVGGSLTQADVDQINAKFTDGTVFSLNTYAIVANLGFKPGSPIANCAESTVSGLITIISVKLSQVRNLPTSSISIICSLARRRTLLGFPVGPLLTEPTGEAAALTGQHRSLLQDRALAQTCDAVVFMRTTMNIPAGYPIDAFKAALMDLVNNELEGACPLSFDAMTVSTFLTATNPSADVGSCTDWSTQVVGAVGNGATVDACVLAPVDVITPAPAEDKGGVQIWIIILAVVLGLLIPLLCCCLFFCLRRRRQRREAEEAAALAHKVGDEETAKSDADGSTDVERLAEVGDEDDTEHGAAERGVAAAMATSHPVDLDSPARDIDAENLNDAASPSSPKPKWGGILPAMGITRPSQVTSEPEVDNLPQLGSSWANRSSGSPNASLKPVLPNLRTPSTTESGLDSPTLGGPPHSRPVSASAGSRVGTSPGFGRGKPALPALGAARGESEGGYLASDRSLAPGLLTSPSTLSTMDDAAARAVGEHERQSAADAVMTDAEQTGRHASSLTPKGHTNSNLTGENIPTIDTGDQTLARPEAAAAAAAAIAATAAAAKPGLFSRAFKGLFRKKDEDLQDSAAPAAAAAAAAAGVAITPVARTKAASPPEQQLEGDQEGLLAGMGVRDPECQAVLAGLLRRAPNGYDDFTDQDKSKLKRLDLADPRGWAALARAFRKADRPGGLVPSDLSDEERARLAKAGVASAEAQDVLLRLFKGAHSPNELSDSDRAKLAASGVSDAALAALQRVFKRGGSGSGPAAALGDDSDDDAVQRARLRAAGLTDRNAQDTLIRLFKHAGGVEDLSDEDRANLALAGLTGPAARRLLRRGGAPESLSQADRDAMEKAGVWDPETQDVCARLFKHGGGPDELSDEDRNALASAGISGPAALSALSRMFKRGAGGDLSADEKGRMQAAGVTNRDQQAALARLFKRGAGGDLSSAEVTAMQRAGMSARAIELARAFRRGGGADLTDDEIDELRSIGVTDPSQQALLARMFKRGTGGGDLSGDDPRDVAAAGLSDPAVQSALRRLFGRGGDGEELSLDEHLELSSAQLGDEDRAAAMRRAFKRGIGGGELGDDELARLGQEGLLDPEALAKLGRALKRPGSFGELSPDEKDALRDAGFFEASTQGAIARALRRGDGGGDLGDDDDDDLARDIKAAGLLDTSKQATLARAFRRPGGVQDVGDDDHSVLAKAGLFDPAVQASLARKLGRPGGFGDLSIDDRSAINGLGLNQPPTQAALVREFKRAAGFGDLGESDKTALASVGIKSAEAQAAFDRFFKRPGGHGNISDADQKALAKAGFDTDNPAAVKAVARFFRRGVGGELSPEESDALTKMGVDPACSPDGPAALARVFRRPGRFTDPGPADREALAACGVDITDARQLAALQRVFRRAGGFGDLSDDEAVALAVAGIDVSDAAASRALARLFMRGGAWGDLSEDERSRCVAEGVDLGNAKTAKAVKALFKRPGGFNDPWEEEQARAHAPVALTSEAAWETSSRPPPRDFKRAAGVGGESEFEGMAAPLPGASAEEVAAYEEHRRLMRHAAQGPMHGDAMIGPIETMSLGEESPSRGLRPKLSPLKANMGWGGSTKVAAKLSPLSKLAAATSQSEIQGFRTSPDAGAGPSTSRQ